MSRVAIAGNVSGTGVFTLESPNSNTDRTLVLPDAAGTLDRLNRAGNVLQVVSTAKTDTFSTASTSLVDVTGLSVSITPSSATSKILICCYVTVGTPNTNYAYINLLRGSTAICIGDAASNRPRVTGMSFSGVSNDGVVDMLPIIFLDSPNTTSSTTYKIQIRCATAGNAYVNRSSRDQDLTTNDIRQASTITAMEIAA